MTSTVFATPVADMSEDDLRSLIARATCFRVDDELVVETRGETGWAVCRRGGRAVVNTDLEMEYEPLPSNRDEAFIARTRFPLEKAFELAERYIEAEKQKGLTTRGDYHGTQA